MYYLLVKDAHVTFAALSVGLFVVRFLCSMNQAAILRHRWMRVLPHVIDSLLLACGLTLMTMLGAWPQRTPWLAAKLVALGFYIGFGVLAFRWSGRRVWRYLFAGLAVAAFAYIVLVAVTKTPMPF